MASTSPAELAREVAALAESQRVVAEEPLDALTTLALDPDEGLAGAASRALFTLVVERLADLFEPALCEVYAQLFSRVIARAHPRFRAEDLEERYREVRTVRAVQGDPANVFVLSRVTLGADVAVTSIVLDGARRRFPASNLYLVGPQKSWELFERSLRVRHVPLPYGRGALLADRLATLEPLSEALAGSDSILLDPDSRLTQLGLLPVCESGRHYLFESRAYGGDSSDSLVSLTKRWVEETLGVEGAEPWLHPKYSYTLDRTAVALSLGVGENPAKRLVDPFESSLIRLLASTGRPVMIDAGAPGSEEESRVQRALADAGVDDRSVGLHQGSFASFAAMIAASSLYTGYDSAGQHVAAALGVPLISVFAGFVSPRMMARWTPDGPGPRSVIPAREISSREQVESILERVRDAIANE